MARPRKTMDTYREILRHVLERKLSGNETHAILNESRGLIQECVRRARAADLSWDEISALSDPDLFAKLFPEKSDSHCSEDPDWQRLYDELQRRGVTLRLLHKELIESQNFHLSYSQFCRRFSCWTKAQKISMRQIHVGGESLFVDFAGMTAKVTNPDTGEVSSVQIFVATFGASNYIYFEAVASQKLCDWILAHIHAFQFFGGVPKFVVPDNLKSAVIDCDRFDPIINKTYRRFSIHYNFAVKPARSGKPKDKAKVEKAVQHVEYSALARIRDRTFFSIDELNRELATLRDEINSAPFQKLSGSRSSRFQELDLPALRALPAEEFEFEEWIVGYRVPKDYHVNVLGNFYSVPFGLAHKIVDVRYTKYLIEVLHANQRVASHIRNWNKDQTVTAQEHMTPAHALYRGLSSEFFLEQASLIGPNTLTVVQHLLNSKPQPQLSYTECFGIVRSLKNNFGSEDVELACAQAIRLQAVGYRVVKSILTAGVKTLPEQMTMRIGNIDHENLRGSDFYQ